MRLRWAVVAAAAALAAYLIAPALISHWEDQIAFESSPGAAGTGISWAEAHAVYVNTANLTSVLTIKVEAFKPTTVDKIVVVGYLYRNETLPLNCTIAPPLPAAVSGTAAFTARCRGLPVQVLVYHGGWAVQAAWG